jgi:hypothetical protein
LIGSISMPSLSHLTRGCSAINVRAMKRRCSDHPRRERRDQFGIARDGILVEIGAEMIAASTHMKAGTAPRSC